MSSIAVIESSGPLRTVPSVGDVEPGTRGIRVVRSFGFGGTSIGSPVGAGARLGSGYLFRSSSRRRRRISSAEGSPNGPVRRWLPDVGAGSSLGNVGAVVPLGGGCRMTRSEERRVGKEC